MLARIPRIPRLQNYHILTPNHARTHTTQSKLNQGIIEMLKQCREEETKSLARDKYRIRAFTNGINTISSLDYPIETPSDIPRAKGIGPGITARIVAHLNNEPYNKEKLPSTIYPFLEVPELGITKAKALMEAGCSHPKDLKARKFQKMLPDSVKLQVKYLGLDPKPATREQAETLASFIRESLTDTRYEIIVAGDHRQGADTSPEINMLLLHPFYTKIPTPDVVPKIASLHAPGRRKTPFWRSFESLKDHHLTNLKSEVLVPLERRRVLVDHFHSSYRKWQGIVLVPERLPSGEWAPRLSRIKALDELNGPFQRLDISMAPVGSRGAALLALTGSIEFYDLLREQASAQGLYLNEYGLWRFHPEGENNDKKPKGSWELIASETEADIMAKLGFDFVEPEQRYSTLSPGEQRRGRRPPDLSLRSAKPIP